jgi:hypothetical protein
MALDQTRATDVLTWMHGGSAPTALNATSKLRIYTAVGNATTAGTEVATGGGYTAGTGVTLSWAAASAGSQATNAIAGSSWYSEAGRVGLVDLVQDDGLW